MKLNTMLVHLSVFWSVATALQPFGTTAPGATSASNYTAAAGASDLEAILNFLNINKTLILAHDKGVDLATSLALDTPELVDRIILAEYSPPGYGYSTSVTSPQPYQSWQ